MLRLEQLTKTYAGGVTALHPLSLTVAAGEFVVVLGRSGSGKSTLLRCINRLVEPTAGRVFLDGEEITGAGAAKLRRLRRGIGMIFQDYNLVPRASVLTNVLCGRLGATPSWAALLNHFAREDVILAHENLERLEMADQVYKRADRLSGGQQQRVGIARALMQQPRLILADEPISSLDPGTARTILEILREINRKDGVTLICNLHLPELALEFGGRILALHTGRLVYDGPPGGLEPAALTRLYENRPL